jgi:hypothetical protein
MITEDTKYRRSTAQNLIREFSVRTYVTHIAVNLQTEFEAQAAV